MIRKVAFGSFSVSFSSDDAEENGGDRRKKKRRKGVHEIGEHDSLSWLTASYGRWTSVSRCCPAGNVEKQEISSQTPWKWMDP